MGGDTLDITIPFIRFPVYSSHVVSLFKELLTEACAYGAGAASDEDAHMRS